MKRYQSIRLSWELPILVMSVLSLTLMISSFWTFQRETGDLEQRTNEMVKERLSNMQRCLESLLRLNQGELIAEQIADFSNIPDVNSLALVDEQGQILYASQRIWIGKAIAQLVPEFDAQYFSSVQQDRRVKLYHDKAHAHIIAYQPVSLGTLPGEIRPNRIGMLLLDYNQAAAQADIRDKLWQQLAINLLISASTMLLLVLILRRWLSRPLNYLLDSVKRISQGDFKTQVEIHGKGELAELGAAVNKMRNDLVDAQTQSQTLIQRLLTNEKELQQITDALPGPVSRFDLAGRYLFASAAYQNWFGVKPEEVIGKSLTDFSGAERYATYEPHIKQAMAGKNVTFEIVLPSPSGGERDALVTMWPDFGKDGEVCGYFTICMDITERKRAEELFRYAVEAAPNSMLMVDEQSIIVLVNSRTYDLFGYTQSELIGQPLNLLLPQQYHEAHAEYMKEFFDYSMKRRMGAGRDLWGLHKQGHTIPLEVGLNPLVTHEGRFVIASAIDITERKLAIEKLQERNAEIERFTHMVSHDLKSPLVTIKTFLSYLQQDMLTADAAHIKRDVDFMVKAADKMECLIEELLEMSRIGRVVTPPEHITWRTAVQEALDINAGVIAQRGVAVTVEGDDIVLLGERARLVQIWQNLIDNAVKFMGDQTAPEIFIGLERDERGTVFYVCDNGMGVDARYRDKIFGMFKKLDAQAPGTGLGLALIKRIVQLYRGEISVDSSGIGRGACFRFTLPEALKTNQPRS